MKTVTSPRRQIVMAALLGLAVVGAAMRYWADNPSLARDIGTLLLVLWLPAVGNLVAFAIRKLGPGLRQPRGFAGGSPFTAQLCAEISPLQLDSKPSRALAANECNCTLVVGTEGFSARSARPLSQLLAPGVPHQVDLEFLRPAIALPRLPPGTRFGLLAGTRVVATGRVIG